MWAIALSRCEPQTGDAPDENSFTVYEMAERMVCFWPTSGYIRWRMFRGNTSKTLYFIKIGIPRAVKFGIFFLRNASQDAVDSALQRRDPLTPPRRLAFAVGDGFHAVGQEFLRYFVELAGLKPGDAVLDVGCGVGRMAVPLTGYLSSSGRYEGFDIVLPGIEWCTEHISSRFPNFRFRHSNVFNANYNRAGTVRASEYAFPYPDATFDFVFLTSVFTHMLPEDLENYLAQISRVMKAGGRCLLTFFLLNSESLRLIDENQSTQRFKYAIPHGRTSNLTNPEWSISYEETFVRSLLSKHSLTVTEPIHYGRWCSRQNYVSYQDLIIATKVGPESKVQ